MKKKYINPTIEVMKISTTCMLATSGFEGNLGGDGGNGSNALSPEYYIDDNE